MFPNRLQFRRQFRITDLIGVKVTDADLNAVFHFTFVGKESAAITVTIRDQTLQVQEGLQGKSDLRMTADSQTWLGFLAREKSLLWALLRRKIRVNGSFNLLRAFSKCFPS